MSTRADRSEAVFRGLPVFKELSTSKAVEVCHHLVCGHMVKQPSMVDQPVSHHAGMTRTDESCVLSAFPPVWCNISRGKKYPARKKPFPISLNNRSGVLGELFQQLRTGGNPHLGLNADYFLWHFATCESQLKVSVNVNVIGLSILAKTHVILSVVKGMGREEEVIKTLPWKCKVQIRELPENHPRSLSGPVFRSSAIPTTFEKHKSRTILRFWGNRYF